jgi:hypothetical protein
MATYAANNTENVYNDMYTGTSNVMLAKHWLWLPDDGLCKLKHPGATVIILNVFNNLQFNIICVH